MVVVAMVMSLLFYLLRLQEAPVWLLLLPAGGGGGSSLFCGGDTIAIQTRQAGNNKVFFINSFLVRRIKPIIPRFRY
jgi:hypothetical protein